MICSRSFPRSPSGAAWARCWRKVRGGPPWKSATPANIGRCTSRDLELPGYEPRSLKTMALGLAVSPRGACHNRSGAYEADFSGEVDRSAADSGRGAFVAASEDFAAVLDSLIVCKFLRKCFSDFYGEARSC